MAEEGQVLGVHTVDEWSDHLQKGIDNKKLVSLGLFSFVFFFLQFFFCPDLVDFFFLYD